MPVYSYPLAGEPVGGAVSGTAQAPYAYARRLDPGTGDLRVSGPTWERGAPMAEVVVRVLRTPKGRYLPDPEFGVDLALVSHARPGAAAAFRASILDALRRYERQGLLRDVAVTVTADGSRLFYDVAFRDPRVPTLQLVRGSV